MFVRVNWNDWNQELKLIYRIKAYLSLHVSSEKKTGGGRNVKFQNYDWPFFSEHQKCLFSSSLLLHQNIESLFLVDHNYEIDKDHYYENHNVEKNVKR